MTSAADLLSKVPQNLSFDHALELILRTVPENIQTQNVSLAQGYGRTLGAALIAHRNSPAANVSAMDGYALAWRDLSGGPLKLSGETAAGQAAAGPLKPGTARRIFTGAILPDGADTILVQEHAVVSNGHLIARIEPSKGAFVRPKGFDFKDGQTLLTAGTILSPRAIGLAASSNSAKVEVVTKPRVSIISTGDELRIAGQACAPEHVVASNGLTLCALLNDMGASALDAGLAQDTLGSLTTSLSKAAANCDLLITTGGASVGSYDLVQDALAKLGAVPVFWKIMVRPGKPVFLWKLGETLVLGLPGNPVSAYVCARLFAQPWVRKYLGQAKLHESRHEMVLGAPLPDNGPRHQFARAIIEGGKAFPANSQDSSLIRTLQTADVLIERPPHDPAKKMGEKIHALFLA